ncbi:hypothetical protein NG798_19220 [Ancylothrix sp. C2]|uniref:HMA2 domain-containing protein n=1 Tax=Ancylothrix sp. D3o TaxID=2953691 RepID=UPI0021BAA05A|nr:hypothetical protein [Ancylothrix sp. D3o]MCT7951937.1 hypothetical protein [Ancylothrix sp. D3o]
MSEAIKNTNKEQATSNKADPFAAWKSSEYWKTQGKNFLPLIVGLVVTRGLNLAGWRALLGYMVAAGTTRQIIEQLDSETPEVLPTVKNSEVLAKTQQELTPPSSLNYKIVHAIPGRIRLSVPRVAEDIEYAEYLDDLLMRNESVKSVRINRKASSVLVNYNTGIVSDSEMQAYLAEVLDSTQKTEDSEDISVSQEVIEKPVSEKIESKKDDDELPPPPGNADNETIETPTVETQAPILSEQSKIEEVAVAVETISETPHLVSQPAKIEPVMVISSSEFETQMVPVEEAASFWYCLENITKKTVWWLQRGQPLYSALPLGFREAVKVRILAIAALANDNSSQDSLTGLGSLS